MTPTKPPIRPVRGAISSGIKRHERENYHSPSYPSKINYAITHHDKRLVILHHYSTGWIRILTHPIHPLSCRYICMTGPCVGVYILLNYRSLCTIISAAVETATNRYCNIRSVICIASGYGCSGAREGRRGTCIISLCI